MFGKRFIASNEPIESVVEIGSEYRRCAMQMRMTVGVRWRTTVVLFGSIVLPLSAMLIEGE